MNDDRIVKVIDFIDRGISGNDLIQTVIDEFPGVGGYGADQLIKAARRDIMAKGRREEKQKVTGRDGHLSARLKMFEAALAKGDDKLALEALRDIAKIEGIYESSADTKLEIEFLFPANAMYKPMTREMMDKLRGKLDESDHTVQPALGAVSDTTGQQQV